MHSTVVTIGVLTLVCSLHAQGMTGQLGLSGKRPLPLDHRRTTAMATADLDRDGHADIVAGHANSRVTIYWQRGSANQFTPAADIVLGGDEQISSLTPADLDGDGDLDLVVTRQTRGGPDAYTILLIQQAPRAFFAQRLDGNPLPITTGGSHAIVFDANNDGRLDVFVAGNRGLMRDNKPQSTNRLYLNRGKVRFTRTVQLQEIASPDMSWPISADFDGDGDIDVVAVTFGDLRLLLNDGKGQFIRSPTGQLPVTNFPKASGPSVGDINNDGYLDIIVPHGQTYTYPSPSPTIQVLINDGAGTFRDEARSRFSMPDVLWDTRLEDIDGDGDLDLCACRNANFWGSAAHKGTFCAINDGNGYFTDQSTARFPDSCARTAAIELFDLNNDTDLDLVAISGDRITLRTNAGDGHFFDAMHERIPAREHNIVRAQFVNLDNDRWPDIAEISEVVTLRRNLGHGHFGRPQIIQGPEYQVPTCIAVADIDLDGDNDIVVGMAMWTRLHAARVLLYLNNGKGEYTDVSAKQMPILPGLASDIVLADVDNDFDLDIVIANGSRLIQTFGQQNRVYLNDGNGNFVDGTDSTLLNGKDQTTDVEAGDWNNDGFTDLLFANLPTSTVDGTNYLYINRGVVGTYPYRYLKLGTAATQTDASTGIKFADFNADGKLDIIVLNQTSREQLFHHTVYLNRNGETSDAIFVKSPSSIAFGVGDFDLDGDTDVICGTDGSGTGKDRVLINNGRGLLVDETTPRLQPLRNPSTSLAVADIDGDGDPDLLAVQDGFTRILINHHRQLETPRLPQLGSKDFVYRISGEPGYAHAPIGSLPIYSTRLLKNALRLAPTGSFYLDFRYGFVGRAAMIEMNRGTYEHAVPIPNDPSLEGVEIHCQCLIWHRNPNSSARFSNLITDRVRRY